MARQYPKIQLEHAGKRYTISYEAYVECDNCDNVWPTISKSDRPTCSACGYKTDRNIVGARHIEESEHVWASASSIKEMALMDAGHDPQETPLFEAEVDPAQWHEFATRQLRTMADRIDALVANGWEIVDVTRDGRMELENDEFTAADESFDD